MKARRYQHVTDTDPRRSDHIWTELRIGWKCVTCGAVTIYEPPAYPTPTDWRPMGYETVSDEERKMCPLK